MSTQLRRASRLWGLQTSYSDFDQKPVQIPETTLKRLLEALCGIRIDRAGDLDRAIRLAHEARVRTILEPTVVAFAREPFDLSIILPREAWTENLTLTTPEGDFKLTELKTQRASRVIEHEGRSFERRIYQVPCRIETGYFTLQLKSGSQNLAKAHLLSRPPKKAQPHPKTWGVFAPLYALKSDRNFGIGDFADMERTQKWIHDLGGDFFGTLPLFSALNEGEGADPSPYSPVSRLFWNEIYLDVESLARSSEHARDRLQSPKFQEALSALRKTEIVDYKKVFALKKEILELLSEDFFAENGADRDDFKVFVNREPLVVDYAKFRANLGGAKQAETGSAEALKIERYHLYVQFRAHQALEKIASAAKAGRTAGLYLDFPVGVSRSGFDADFFESAFLESASAGAPPDLLFHGGQDWGFAPFHPREIRKTGYEYFRHCLRINLQFATVLRLDHIMAFYRLYAIPKGVSPKEGGYIRYRSEEFFAVLAIEGERSGARVVGEDLGTVPDEVRQLIIENDCLRMWVLPFEANQEPSKAIRKIPSQTLACLNTHDLIPLAGYLDGHDSELFNELGLLETAEMKTQLHDRKKTVEAWKKDLGAKSVQDVLRESLKLLGRSSAEMVLVNIEDLWDETEPQNVPGTWRERPNWQRKLKLNLTEIETSQQVQAPLKALASERQEHS